MKRQAFAFVVLVLALVAAPASAFEPGTPAFERTWDRTDRPVAEGVVSRTWLWGPAVSEVMQEEYVDAPGDTRTVQYFEKSRMEITDPDADQASPWYVTNGLLALELITGRVQIGDDIFIERPPAELQVAGDADALGGAPTYAAFNPLRGYQPLPVGATLVQRVNEIGFVWDDPGLAGFGVTAAYLEPATNHTVASVFWDYLWSSGTVYQDGALTTDSLFPSPFYATGYPITEAYWAFIAVDGYFRDVLIQAFERRILTYTPGNPPGWEVEAGNVGLHYYQWRYTDRPGGRLAFEMEGDIYAVNADGTGLTNLTNSPDTSESVPVWSPDGSRIMFARMFYEGDRYTRTSVVVMNADGTGQVEVTDDVTANEDPGDWSPDGERIVVKRAGDGLYTMKPDGSERRLLVETNAAMVDWSPDGQRILFDSLSDGHQELFTIDVDGTNRTQLTDSPFEARYGQWSPDGSMIVYTAAINGLTIWVMDADGSNERQISREPAGSWSDVPSWSDDSRSVVFHSEQSGIWIAGVDGAEYRQLSWGGQHPDWSPDGRWIAFSAYGATAQIDLYVVHPDGSARTRVTVNEYYEITPAWQPT